MPDIDASIPLRAGQGVTQPINYLTMAQHATDLANAQQNLLTARAQGAAGQDFQNAIGPDGQLNGNQLNQNLANDPEAARAAVATSQAGQSNLQTTLANHGMTQQQGLAMVTFIGNQTGAVLASGKPVTHKDVQNVMANGVNAGIIPVKDAAQLIGATSQMSSDDLTSYAKQWYAGAQHGAQALAPTATPINTGGSTNLINTNPMASVPMGAATGQPIPNTLTPQDLAAQVPGQNQQGLPVLRNMGQVLQAEGGAPAPSAQPPQMTPQQIMAQATQMANEGAPGAHAKSAEAWMRQQLAAQGRNPQINDPSASGQPPQASTMPSGAIPNGPAPGVTDAAATLQKQAADMVVNATNQIQTIPTQRAALQSALSQVDTANPGQLNEVMTKVNGILTQLHIGNGEQPTASQLLHKDVMQGVMQSLASVAGGATDSKMGGLIQTTPQGNMTPEASRVALEQMKGTLDYLQTYNEQLRDYTAKNGTQSAPDFQRQWVQKYPTASVYQFKYLPEAERSKYMQSLSPPQQQAFAKQMEEAGTLPSRPSK